MAAAVAVAFYPPMIAATTQLTSEPLGALALTAALAAVAWAWSRGRAAGFAAAGVAVGLACLVRADVLLAALVLAPAVGLLHARRDDVARGRRRRVRDAAGRAGHRGALERVREPARPAFRADHRRRLRRRSSSAPTSRATAPSSASSTRSRARRCACTLRSATRPIFRLREKVFLDAVAARHPRLSRDAAISAELHRNLRVYLLGRPVAFARMLAAKTWRMWAFPFRGTFRRVSATTLWLHRVLVALALLGSARRA